MNDELDTLSDDKLNEVFAVEVMGADYGWSGTGAKGPDGYRWRENGETKFCYRHQLPNFSTDANAVLPWLDRIAKGGWRVSGAVNGWIVSIWQCKGDQPDAEVRASTLPRAAAIALIRGKRTAK